MKNKKIVITGATGLIGKHLCMDLSQNDYQLIILSRNPEKARLTIPGDYQYLAWQPGIEGDWIREIDGAFSVISLAGAPLFGVGRITKSYLNYANQTRVDGVHGLVSAMRSANKKPQVFISSSSVGIYGFQGPDEDIVTEYSNLGTDGWALDNLAWEAEARHAEDLGIRTILLRTGIVWGFDDGMLANQLDQFKRGWGGVVLPGTQWVPWIHITDEIGIIKFCLEHENITGAVNASAPHPIRYNQYTELLSQILKVPARRKTPSMILKLFMGKAATMMLHNRHMLPEKMLAAGYHFTFPEAEDAMRDLIVNQ